jgi:hypothetical protein
MVLANPRLFARTAGILLAMGAVLPLLAPATALAHERRQVGPYTFVVGWINEPAIAGQPNGIDLRISKTDDGSPVQGAEKALKATIAFGGGQPKEFPLRARFGMAGAYTADVIPTKAGSYIFTFTGTLEGNQINERFESGPGRFDDVQPVEKFQFPEVAPAAQATAAATAAAGSDRLAAAEQRAAQAQSFGIAGVVAGVLGLLAGGYALVASRRMPASRPQRPLPEAA